MRYLALCLIFLASPLAFGQQQNLGVGAATAGGRVALVVGNDTYTRVSPLRNARTDAKAMANALRAAGFDVILRTDLDDRALRAAVREFKGRLSGGSDALFYFAGHGVQLGGANYLLPTNISADNEEQVKDDGLSLQRVLDDLAEQKVRFSVAIIDACRDNPFPRVAGRSIGMTRGLAPVSAATGQMVLYSAGSGQRALDQLGANDRDPNGLFTRVLLKQMQQPGVPVDQVLKRTRQEVVRLARSVGHEQVPALYDQTIGEFYFWPAASAQAAGLAPAQVVSAAPAALALAPTVPDSDLKRLAAGSVFRDCSDCPEMVVIPAGSFMMGESNQRSITIPHAFAAGKFEITFEQWDACFTDGGCTHKPDDKGWGRLSRPVMNVNRHDAKQYTAWLSRKSGKAYRLLTEAEWEYAARAGTNTAYYWGENDADICQYASVATGFFGGSGCGTGKTSPVGERKPNAFGLYDMLGNVSEWTETGATRGGSYLLNAGSVRTSEREPLPDETRYSRLGIRVARTQ